MTFAEVHTLIVLSLVLLCFLAHVFLGSNFSFFLLTIQAFKQKPKTVKVRVRPHVLFKVTVCGICVLLVPNTCYPLAGSLRCWVLSLNALLILVNSQQLFKRSRAKKVRRKLS